MNASLNSYLAKSITRSIAVKWFIVSIMSSTFLMEFLLTPIVLVSKIYLVSS